MYSKNHPYALKATEQGAVTPFRQYTRVPAEVRFMAKVEKHPSGCWMWTAAKNPKGYGVFARVGGTKTEMAHRSAYVLFIGEIPSGMFVCHHCDIPGCVNPKLLFLGTAAENTADMVSKWRTRSKLTPQQVKEIRASSEPSSNLAARYGLKSRDTIRLIRAGITFSEVEV